MDALAYDLKTICEHNRDGSHATKANRHRMLQAVSRELRKGGFRLAGARSLKPKHVEFLTKRWKAQGLTAGTMKNRMGAVRWWAEKVNKASVIPRDNGALGIPDRQRDAANRAQQLDTDKLQRVDSRHMRVSIRLMAAFGLRYEESLKFVPGIADKGDHIALAPSWTKGGRYREIPIHSQKHRALLEEAKQVAGTGSMIPPRRSYIEHRKAMEHASLKAGFTNLHGLRHNYAQWRYKALTGRPSPKAGGTKDLNAIEQQIDQEARLTISRELGHNRIEITETYLG